MSKNLLLQVNFLLLLCFILLLSSCSSNKYSIVENEKVYDILDISKYNHITKRLKENKQTNEASSIHKLELITPLRTSTFEHATVYSHNNVRISLYTPNFSKLIYYLVDSEAGSISVDINNKEAYLNYNSKRVYLPNLPEELTSISTYLSIIFGMLPQKVFDDENSLVIMKKKDENDTSLEKKETNHYILKGKLNDAKIEALFTENTNSNEITLDRMIIKSSSDEIIRIDFEYDASSNHEFFNSDFVNIPIRISLLSKKHPIEIYYKLDRFNSKISGNKDSLFSLNPPLGFKIYSLE